VRLQERQSARQALVDKDQGIAESVIAELAVTLPKLSNRIAVDAAQAVVKKGNRQTGRVNELIENEQSRRNFW
jgi:hypothetical protein